MSDPTDVIIVDDSGTEHIFPPGFDPVKAGAIVRAATAPRQDTHGGLPLAAAGPATELAATAATTFSNAPNAAKVGSAIARGGTTLGGIIHGTMTGNVPEIVASPIAGWQAGKGGYWLTKHAQDVAAPVGRLLGKAAPLAHAASSLGVMQGGLDLAQMAEPKRRDIGFMGVGGGTPDANDPAMLNALYERIRQMISK